MAESEATKVQTNVEGPRGVPVLTWIDSAGEHVFRVESRATVGSASENNVVVVNKTVSRIHAEFEVRDDRMLWIRDLGSMNGTEVDGVRVEVAGLSRASRIKLGSVLINVRYEDKAVAPNLWPTGTFGPLVGDSVAMRALFATLARIAPSEAPVFIHGETGTGKELVAKALHDASPRAKGPFVVVDCGAIPETLLDSELFGHAKGSFTGAATAHTGAIESADGGTVFLDEIGELPLSVQPKLLRVLDSKTVRRVGETTYKKVDVRFISATHRDLLTMVSAGHFREDLYFRLAVLPVVVPPLRKRHNDIERLVRHFLPKGATVSPELLRELSGRAWRGNVRELRNFVERAIALGEKEALAMIQSGGAAPPPAAPSLPPPPPPPAVEGAGATTVQGVELAQEFKSFRDKWVEAGEREYLKHILSLKVSVSEGATIAGVDRTYLYRLLRKYSM